MENVIYGRRHVKWIAGKCGSEKHVLRNLCETRLIGLVMRKLIHHATRATFTSPLRQLGAATNRSIHGGRLNVPHDKVPLPSSLGAG